MGWWSLPINSSSLNSHGTEEEAGRHDRATLLVQACGHNGCGPFEENYAQAPHLAGRGVRVPVLWQIVALEGCTSLPRLI
jgi:hypothetical protein